MGASQKNIDFVSQKRLFPVLHRGDAVASFENGAEIGGVPEMEGAGDFVDFAVAFRQHPDGFLEAQKFNRYFAGGSWKQRFQWRKKVLRDIPFRRRFAHSGRFFTKL